MALKTMYPGMVNSPSTKLKQDINEAATIIPVEDLSVFPPPPNIAVIGIDEAAETILYAAIDTAASTLTGCTRALEGTAKTWPATTPIARNFTNFDYNILRENMTDVTATADAAKTTADNAIPKAGGTMTGALTLSGAPTENNHAATKAYVDGSYTIAGKKAGTTLGANATAEGVGNTASGSYSHAEGSYTVASAPNGHSEGAYSVSIGGVSHAEGGGTSAIGDYSHSGGQQTVAHDHCERAIGRYNIVSTGNATAFDASNTAFVIGNGTADDARSNALRLDFAGNMELAGALTLPKAEEAALEPEVCLHVPHRFRPNTDGFYVDTFGNVMINGTLVFGQDSGWIAGDPFVWKYSSDDETQEGVLLQNGPVVLRDNRRASFGFFNYDGVSVTPKSEIRASGAGEVSISSNGENIITMIKQGDAGLCRYSVPITLPADPTENLHAATKQYVDGFSLKTSEKYTYNNVDYERGFGVILTDTWQQSGKHIILGSYNTNPSVAILSPPFEIDNTGTANYSMRTSTIPEAMHSEITTKTYVDAAIAALEARIAALENK